MTRPAKPWRTSFRFVERNGILVLAIVAIVAVFSKVLFSDLVWDDVFLVGGQEGLGEWSTLLDQLTTPFWQNSGYVLGNNTDFWRPLTSAVLWLGGFLFGSWPTGFHFFSMIAALGAGASLLSLLIRLLPAGSDRAPAIWLGLLFIAHPLCAEVVGMVSNISDHLVLIFLSLELGFLIDLARGNRRTAALPLISLFSFLACCSKELGVLGAVAPLAAWLLARASASPDSVPSRRSLISPAPWIAAAGAVVLFLVLRQLVIYTATSGDTLAPVSELDTSWRVFFLGYGLSLEKALTPLPSGFHIILPSGNPPAWVYAWAIAAVSTLAALLAIGIAKWRSLLLSAIGMGVALALVAPALLTIRASDSNMVIPVRYFHLPLAGFMIALLPSVTRFWHRVARFVLPLAIGLLLLLSWVRLDEWKSDVSLFYAEARYNPDSAQTLINLASALYGRGAYNEAERVVGLIEALQEERPSELSLGGILNLKSKIAAYRDGDFEAASALLEEALRRDPTNMVNVFALAQVRADAGHPDQAVTILERAMEAPWFEDSRREKLAERLAEYRILNQTSASTSATPID